MCDFAVVNVILPGLTHQSMSREKQNAGTGRGINIVLVYVIRRRCLKLHEGRLLL